MLTILYPLFFLFLGLGMYTFMQHDSMKKQGLIFMFCGSFWMIYMLMSKGIHLP